jgi:hypothetical protein
VRGKMEKVRRCIDSASSQAGGGGRRRHAVALRPVAGGSAA